MKGDNLKILLKVNDIDNLLGSIILYASSIDDFIRNSRTLKDKYIISKKKNISKLNSINILRNQQNHFTYLMYLTHLMN